MNTMGDIALGIAVAMSLGIFIVGLMIGALIMSIENPSQWFVALIFAAAFVAIWFIYRRAHKDK